MLVHRVTKVPQVMMVTMAYRALLGNLESLENLEPQDLLGACKYNNLTAITPANIMCN